MWLYEKKLEYPVKITTPNPRLAKVIISQLGGPDGELGAATRYLQQRYSMPYAQVKGTLTDIGTEELAHIEMISAILFQLTRCLSPQEIKQSGFDTYFVDHTTGVYPQAASGMPFSTDILQVTGDAIADLYEDLAAEQKARLSYDNILRLIDNPEVADPIRFLREREVVHFQRFGEAMRITQENLDARNFYAFNPSFDKRCNPPDRIMTPTPSPECPSVPPCGCQTPVTAPACGCQAPVTAPACGCQTPVTAPACGCQTPVTTPACGCQTPVTAPSCGCQAPAAPACECQAPVINSCGCQTPISPDCGCQMPVIPVAEDCGPVIGCGTAPAKTACGCQQKPVNRNGRFFGNRGCGCG